MSPCLPIESRTTVHVILRCFSLLSCKKKKNIKNFSVIYYYKLPISCYLAFSVWSLNLPLDLISSSRVQVGSIWLFSLTWRDQEHNDYVLLILQPLLLIKLWSELLAMWSLSQNFCNESQLLLKYVAIFVLLIILFLFYFTSVKGYDSAYLTILLKRSFKSHKNARKKGYFVFHIVAVENGFQSMTQSLKGNEWKVIK